MSSPAYGVGRDGRNPADAPSSAPAQPSELSQGWCGCIWASVSRSQRRCPGSSIGSAVRRIGPVLLAVLARLEHQRDLGALVAQPIVCHPRDLLEGSDLVTPALVGPLPVRFRGERHVENPGCGGVLAHPDLAVGPDVREPGVERPEPALVHVPRRPAVAEEHSERLRVAREHRDVHVLVRSRDTSEDLDGPAANDPPWTVEAGHEIADCRGRQGIPCAVPAFEQLHWKVLHRCRFRGGRGVHGRTLRPVRAGRGHRGGRPHARTPSRAHA